MKYMKNVIRWTASIFFIVILICSRDFYVTAAESGVNPNQLGSITIVLKSLEDDILLPDGELSLYRVAELTEKDGAVSYVYTEAFADCLVDLKQLTTGQVSLVADLAVWSEANYIQAERNEIVSNGTVQFHDLTQGLYLVEQTGVSEGYEKISHFLISIPTKSEGGWQYELLAYPKVSSKDSEQDMPGESPVESDKVPVTGDSLWPIHLLMVSEVIIVRVLRHKRK